MYMSIIINGFTFPVWGTTTINAVKSAITEYNNTEGTTMYSGYPIVDGIKFDKVCHCMGYDIDMVNRKARLNKLRFSTK